MDYAFPPAPGTVLPVDGTDQVVPVRRVYCVGRNYAAHAREMGSDPDREPPFFFMKPADAVVPSGSTIPYPPATADLQHEIELVVVIGRGGRAIAPAAALDHAYGYAVGLDMTRRDLQSQAKKTGRPWDMGKGFDQSAPCSTCIDLPGPWPRDPYAQESWPSTIMPARGKPSVSCWTHSATRRRASRVGPKRSIAWRNGDGALPTGREAGDAASPPRGPAGRRPGAPSAR